MSDAAFDVTIVGGGSSACVLAARLSDDPRCRVLVLEAGPDYARPDAVPQALRNACEPVLAGYNWRVDAQVRPVSSRHGLPGLARTAGVLASAPRDAWAVAKAVVHAPQPAATSLHTFPYVPGKVIGGSSSVNGAVALRPVREDFAAWQAQAGTDWSWEAVLPYFRRLEDDRDFDGPLHGRGGPMPVSRPTAAELSPSQRAFQQACIAQGWPWIDDLNASSASGFGPLPTNAVGGERISTAAAYLMPARARPNLVVRGRQLVQRVVFAGRSAVGVEVWNGGRLQRIESSQVVLCAGALQTPAVLLRSGVGDATRCAALNLASVAHLPGVGRNLIDHPAILFWMVPKSLKPADLSRMPQHQIMARQSSGGAVERADLNLFFLGDFNTAKIAMLAQMLRSPLAHALSVVLARPLSRGQVTIGGTQADQAPLVELNLCDAEADMQRLMAGVRLAWRLACSEPIQALVQSMFMWNEHIIQSDSLLRGAIERFVTGTWHAVGTARMGGPGDAMAVVDARCRVLGLERLHVVDASVMPDIPSTPTHLSCVMLAERAVEWIRAPAGAPS